MTFLELQTEFASLHMDTSSVWIAWWSSNKIALNRAYEDLYDLIKNSEEVKKLMIPSTKTKITLSSRAWNLPVDFDVIDKVSSLDWKIDKDLDRWESRYYDFEVIGQRASKKIVTLDEFTEVYISYLPILTALSWDTDKPISIPAELHRSIVNYALVEYHRMIRDYVEAWNALQFAQGVLNDKISRIW